MARCLSRNGIGCEVFLAAEPAALTGDAHRNLERWRQAGGRILPLGSDDLGTLRKALSSCGLAVDGLFGTGLRGELREPGLSIVRTLNQAPCPIVAVDIPSGLDTDRGVPLGDAVQAMLTVTFAFPKLGLLLHPGVEIAGDMVVADIGITPEAVRAVAPAQELLTDRGVGALFPVRAADSHKGTYGHLLVIGGSPALLGALLLAGRAALRAGAGLVTLATPAGRVDRGITPELMVQTMPEGWHRSDGALADAIEGKSAVVIGPGLGATEATRKVVRWVVENVPLPLVVDADGLNVLAGRKQLLEHRPGPTILTPHPGEASRLLGRSTREIQEDRPGAARDLAQQTGAVVALKGARTLVIGATGPMAINPTGNPGMATGGMGDVLAGMTGALLAQGLEVRDAAAGAVFWHGFAADRVAKRQGEAGLLASDVIEELPLARRDLEECGSPGIDS
jgi:NAD(P)H-hydrate epimerase